MPTQEERNAKTKIYDEEFNFATKILNGSERDPKIIGEFIIRLREDVRLYQALNKRGVSLNIIKLKLEEIERTLNTRSQIITDLERRKILERAKTRAKDDRS